MTGTENNLAVAVGQGVAVTPAEKERLKVMFEAHYDLVWRVLETSLPRGA